MVDIVIPTYNRCSQLKCAVQSVLDQSFLDWTLFIVDDGSTDETSQWLAQISDPRVQHYTIENSGVSVARNFGANLGKAPWIAFLDSDDFWRPTKLEKSLNGWDQLSPLIHTQENWVRNNQPQNQPLKYLKKAGNLFEENIQHCAIGPSTVLIQRPLWELAGGFNPELPVCEDQELWLRLCLQHTVCLIDEALTTKTAGHDDQLSRTPLIEEWRLKILLPYLENDQLPAKTIEILRSTLTEKMKRLKRGYKKYHRTDKLKWLEQIQHKWALSP